jgi:hypothetical protein
MNVENMDNSAVYSFTSMHCSEVDRKITEIVQVGPEEDPAMIVQP